MNPFHPHPMALLQRDKKRHSAQRDFPHAREDAFRVRQVKMTLIGLVVALSGCASMVAEGLLETTLGLVGLQKAQPVAPASAESLKPAAPTKLALRIHASPQLNSAPDQKPLAVLIQVHKLSGYEEFLQLPYAAFAQGKPSAQGIVAQREVVLVPGQRYEVEELLPKDTAYLAVSALFRSPDLVRWRFVFDTTASAKAGITMGAHQCALSVTEGVAVGSTPEALRLAGSTCR